MPVAIGMQKHFVSDSAPSQNGSRRRILGKRDVEGPQLTESEPVSTERKLTRFHPIRAIAGTGTMDHEQSVQTRLRVPQRAPRHQLSEEVLRGIAFRRPGDENVWR